MPDQDQQSVYNERFETLREDIHELRATVKELTTAVAAIPLTSQRLDAVAAAWVTALDAAEQRWTMETKAINERVGKVEAWQTWALRLVVSAVVLALLGYALHNPTATSGL